MHRIPSLALCITLVQTLSAVVPAQAQTTWYVDHANPKGCPGMGTEGNPFCLIQDGIAASTDGDECVVAPGTYFETINLLGKAITLRSSEGADVTTIDADGGGSVVTCDSGEGQDTVLSGFVVTGGTGSPCPLSDSCGGGMFNEGSAPTVTNCIFSNNTAGFGGGMYNDASNPTVTNCTFSGNSAGAGGGMVNLSSSSTVTNCTFTGNTGSNAGGMGNYGASPTVTNCIFSGNSATGGGSPGIGGGMLNAGEGNPTVSNCTFSNNSADVGGGMRNTSNPTVTNCTFIENTAGAGGGMSNQNNSQTLINCAFIGNAGISGGAMSVSNSTGTMINCSFSGNSAAFWGGAINLDFPSGPTTLVNCVLWNNSPDEINGTATVTYSNVAGGYPGDGNIDADPLFVDADSGDLRLMPGSPCIDAGDNSAVPEGIVTDLDGNSRFVDDPDTPDTGNPDGVNPIVDMGAYEFQGQLLANLDIKLGSCPNPFNRHGNGVLPVALVGNAEFDAAEVDLSTLQLSRADGVGGSVAPNEGPPGPHSVLEDVATPFDGKGCECHDLGGDGIDDLSMKFKTRDLVDALELDELPGGAVVELVLSGSLLDGTPFVAGDCIVIVPPGDLGPINATVGSNVGDTFIEVTPLDLNIDSDGFTSFGRAYYAGTLLTVTAPPTSEGRRFVRWMVEGVLQEIGVRTIEVAVTENTTLQALYHRQRRLRPDRPIESDEPLD